MRLPDECRLPNVQNVTLRGGVGPLIQSDVPLGSGPLRLLELLIFDLLSDRRLFQWGLHQGGVRHQDIRDRSYHWIDSFPVVMNSLYNYGIAGRHIPHLFSEFLEPFDAFISRRRQ